ncbi:unnamed protein product, partial [Trichobilharzia regenti]
MVALCHEWAEVRIHGLANGVGHSGLMRQRISASDALNHPFLEEARLRYHSCMCSCCHDVSSNSGNEGVQTTTGFCCAPSPSASSSCASSSTPSSDSMQGGSSSNNNGKFLNNRYEAKTAANAMPSGSSNSAYSSS